MAGAAPSAISTGLRPSGLPCLRAAVNLFAHPEFSGAITDVPGIKVGHFTETRRPTGCTVILCEEGRRQGWMCAALPPARGRRTC